MRVTEFSGKVHWVEIDIDAAAKDADHRLAPEERLQLGLTRQ